MKLIAQIYQFFMMIEVTRVVGTRPGLQNTASRITLLAISLC